MQVLLDEQPIEYLLVGLPILAILADVYWDSEQETPLARAAPIIKNAVAVALVVALGLAWFDSTYFRHLLAVPVLMLVIEVFYMLDIIRGGADAKSLMALAIMFPFYPKLDGIPLLEYSEDAL